MCEQGRHGLYGRTALGPEPTQGFRLCDPLPGDAAGLPCRTPGSARFGDRQAHCHFVETPL